MIIQLAILGILYLLMTGLPSLTYGTGQADATAVTTAVLGFILLASFFFGRISTIFRLPQITGYLLAGILFGPYGLGLFEIEHVERLKLIDDIALAFIALAVGGELEMGFLKKHGARIITITSVQFATVFSGVVIVFYMAFRFSISEILPQSTDAIFAALVLGVIAAANSPATAMAVINETRAKGAVTESTLGITVIKDLFVITSFAFIVSWIHSSTGTGTATGAVFSKIIIETFLSILTGAAIGFFVIIYMSTLKGEMLLFTLGVSVFASVLSSHLELNELLVCVTAGFVAKNFSKNGDSFIHAIEQGSLPIFVIFFSLAGASLNLYAVKLMWMSAIFYFSVRLFLTWISTVRATALTGETLTVQKNLWGGFVSQAGVSLGLAIIVRNQFPGWGEPVSTLIVATVAINQLAGPVIFKFLLTAAGETGKQDYSEEVAGEKTELDEK